MPPSFRIGSVAELTGLSVHTIRAWERRHQVLEPGRSATNRRLYDEQDVRRLALLFELTQSGHSIGQVASLSDTELIDLMNLQRQHGGPKPSTSPLAEVKHCIQNLNERGLAECISNVAATVGARDLIFQLIVPTIYWIETEYDKGRLGISHEHLASMVIRNVLEETRRRITVPTAAPRIVVTTPAHQLHELGAGIVAVLAAAAGWHVTYLGPNMPAADIAAAVEAARARVVALSVVYPADDPVLSRELASLRSLIGPDCTILIGGRASAQYRQAIERAGAQALSSLEELIEVLNDLGGWTQHRASISN